VTLKRFSKDYRSYGEWLRAQPRESRYAKEIIRKHERHPRLSLNELRHLRLSDHDLSTSAWHTFTAQQKSDRTTALEILRRMRRGERLAPVLRDLGVRKDFAVKQLGQHLHKSQGYWRVTATDKIQAEMRFYDSELGHISIVTANSRDRKLIGKYFAAVKKAVNTGDTSALKPFRNRKIMDADGVEHYFETDLDRLYEIEEAQEEPEFLEIYKNGGV
jgi:hypothetical protein